MSSADYKFEWKGGNYNAKLRTLLQSAVFRSALVVQNASKELLNTSGKSGIAKTGLNQVRKKKGMTDQDVIDIRRRRGEQTIQNLKTVTNKRGDALTFGGSFTDKNKIQYDRVYWYAEPLHRWVQSSVPGTPPHKQTGTLQRSIAVERYNDNLSAKIGPAQNLIYGRIHELGGKGLIKLPPRPYLRPAFQAKQTEIFAIIQDAVKKATI